MLTCQNSPCWQSFVPRPSASRARIAYVTFEPLSDGTTPTSFTSKVLVDTVMKLLDYKYAFEFILIPRRQQRDANSVLTAIQHALTFDYSGVSLTKRLVIISYCRGKLICSYLGYYNRPTRSSIPDASSGPPR